MLKLTLSKLRTLIREALNEATCPCGIERDTCTYHREASPEMAPTSGTSIEKKDPYRMKAREFIVGNGSTKVRAIGVDKLLKAIKKNFSGQPVWVVAWDGTGGYDLKASIENIKNGVKRGMSAEFDNACLDVDGKLQAAGIELMPTPDT